MLSRNINASLTTNLRATAVFTAAFGLAEAFTKAFELGIVARCNIVRLAEQITHDPAPFFTDAAENERRAPTPAAEPAGL